MSEVHASTLGDSGDRDAPVGSRPWATWLVGQIRLQHEECERDQRALQRLLGKLDNQEAWRVLGYTSRDEVLPSGLVGRSHADAPIETRSSPRVVNLRHEDLGDCVYVGRASPHRGLPESPFGNPFKEGRDGTRAEVIEKYRSWLLGRPAILQRLHELRGRRLACWCKPLPCHADVLIELADADEILDALAAAGVAVQAVDGRLRLSPPSAVDAALRARVAAHKPGILALLAARPATLPEQRRECRAGEHDFVTKRFGDLLYDVCSTCGTSSRLGKITSRRI